ncbi:hypothetical protein [Endozoicomonas numazuensis]|uniref:Uncharacterized protein n=1 Tax=Endozoicomonas numazuensis TaxID=1137799 RepID=A0A081NEH9_9GAMM|nr:hypothetical protein [Endozoicomonas numazuensis]KEQ16852.1 hypothetical protein GZ78_19510 [Endozoicomonas numazuensis]
MNIRPPLIITLLLFFIFPSAHAVKECQDISTLPMDKQTQTFMDMKESFIGTMKPSEHLDQIRELATDPALLDEIGDLPLQSFPGIIEKRYPSVPKTILHGFTDQIEKLDRIADCFHHGKRNKDALMKLRYRKVKATDNPYIGFLLPKKTDQPRKVKVTSKDTCYDKRCVFTEINVDDLDKDVILLVHRPARLSTPVIHYKPVFDPKTAASKRLPERAYLLELDLQKVGEYFSKPEIYAHITYYNGDQPIREDTIEIPWAKEKGFNQGKTELIIWLNADSVQLTLLENDWEIPFRLIGKILSKAVGLGLQLASASHPEIGQIQTALGDLRNRSSSEEPDFYDALERMNADDLLDTIRLQRTHTDTYIPMKQGVVKMTLKHDYTPKTGLKNEL